MKAIFCIRSFDSEITEKITFSLKIKTIKLVKLFLKNLSSNCKDGNQNAGQCPTIISRQIWRARNPLRQIPIISSVDHIFIHHTDDGNSCFTNDSCALRIRSLQSYHQLNKRWADIAWNFIIGLYLFRVQSILQKKILILRNFYSYMSCQ